MALPLRKTQASLCLTVAQSQTAHVFDFSYSNLYDKKKNSHKKCNVYDVPFVCLLRCPLSARVALTAHI